jgi:hypothetical protein
MVGSGVKVGKQLSLGADLIRVVGNAADRRATCKQECQYK